jgi:prolyl oligopeptidase
VDLSKILLVTATACGLLFGADDATPATAKQPPPPAPAPPVAAVQPVTDTYFGTTLSDPYRWMEAEPEPQFRDYLQQQTDFTHATLDRIAGRTGLLHDIAGIDGLTTSISGLVRDGDTLFYLKRGPGDDIAKLVMRDIKGGREILLVDPATLGGAGSHVEIDQFAPSMDGLHVAYGISEGGSEKSVLHIMDLQGRHDLPEKIDRAQFANVSWAADGRSFYYARLPPPVANAPATEHYSHLTVYQHRLGTNPKSDPLVLNSDRLPFPFTAAQAYPAIVVTPQSDYALAMISDGVSPELTIYAAHLAELDEQPTPWTRVAVPADGVTAASIRGSLIFLLTHKDAPRFRVTVGDLADGAGFSTRTVIPQSDGVLTGIAAASDALYVSKRNGMATHVERLDYDKPHADELKLPFAGAVEAGNGGLATDPRATGAVFSLESWIKPVVWLRYDPDKRAMGDIHLVPDFPNDLSAYQVTETEAVSPDGIHVPLSIIARKDVAMDHARPTLLDGYGSYGISYDPEFLAGYLPFFDRGGVFAVAHVRGGGELGQPWHDAGKIATKQNTITDFLACAQKLIDLGYTDHAHLAGTGTSAGGVTIGGAITRDPAMFGAALIRVGATNAVREEEQENGPSNIPEFGTVKNKAQFGYLYGMDAYQHVKDGTPYPAVLLTGGLDDPRVAVWEPAKMAARLQAATSSGKPVLLRIEFDAGHGIGSTRTQYDAEQADELSFLLWQMAEPGFGLEDPKAAKGKKKAVKKHV